jgi:hypothetical protein
MKNRIAVISLAVGVVGGGLAGLALGVTSLAGAASGPTPTSNAPNAPTTPGPSTGSTPKSNEDGTHESGESTAREADENAGRVGHHFGGHHFGGHHGDNENPSHDSTETPQREQQEDARTNTAPSSGTAPSTPAPGI